MFVFVLYPYVYLLTRTAFIERASGMLEASRTSVSGPGAASSGSRCHWPGQPWRPARRWR
jgi:hypothetical protein